MQPIQPFSWPQAGGSSPPQPSPTPPSTTTQQRRSSSGAGGTTWAPIQPFSYLYNQDTDQPSLPPYQPSSHGHGVLSQPPPQPPASLSRVASSRTGHWGPVRDLIQHGPSGSRPWVGPPPPREGGSPPQHHRPESENHPFRDYDRLRPTDLTIEIPHHSPTSESASNHTSQESMQSPTRSRVPYRYVSFTSIFLREKAE